MISHFFFITNIKHPKVIRYAACNTVILIVIPNIYPFVPLNVLIYLIPYTITNTSDHTEQSENNAISILFNTSLAVNTYTTK